MALSGLENGPSLFPQVGMELTKQVELLEYVQHVPNSTLLAACPELAEELDASKDCGTCLRPRVHCFWMLTLKMFLFL